MFNVHWKKWSDEKQDWEFFSRKVKAANPSAASHFIMKEYEGVIIQKVKKC